MAILISGGFIWFLSQSPLTVASCLLADVISQTQVFRTVEQHLSVTNKTYS